VICLVKSILIKKKMTMLITKATVNYAAIVETAANVKFEGFDDKYISKPQKMRAETL
jgi:hypothetical protein